MVELWVETTPEHTNITDGDFTRALKYVKVSLLTTEKGSSKSIGHVTLNIYLVRKSNAKSLHKCNIKQRRISGYPYMRDI